jgi:hypothetical protein
MGMWAEDIEAGGSYGKIESNKEDDSWITGDSYFEPCYCPHGYSLAEGSESERIVSYTTYNEPSEYKKYWRQQDLDQLDLELKGREWSHCYNILERYRTSGIISKRELCEATQISIRDTSIIDFARPNPDVIYRQAQIR